MPRQMLTNILVKYCKIPHFVFVNLHFTVELLLTVAFVFVWLRWSQVAVSYNATNYVCNKGKECIEAASTIHIFQRSDKNAVEIALHKIIKNSLIRFFSRMDFHDIMFSRIISCDVFYPFLLDEHIWSNFRIFTVLQLISYIY